MKILISAMLMVQLLTLVVVVDTRIELMEIYDGLYNSVTAIMEDLTTRNVGDRFSRGDPAIY